MMKRILSFLFGISVCASVFAQAGYMGKRFVAGYGFHFSPALAYSNGSGNSMNGSFYGRSNSETGELAFNSLHEGFLEFSIKNRTMMGLSAKYCKTTYDNAQWVEATYISTDQYGYNQIQNISSNVTGLYDIRAMNYMLYFKFYRKGYLAPWGKYFMIGPNFTTIKTNYNPQTMKVKDVKEPIDFGPAENNFLRADLLFGFGRSRVLFDRLTLDYGINFCLFGLVTTGDDLMEDFMFYEFRDNMTNTDYIERTSKRRVRSLNRVNAYLRIGFLLF